MELDTVRNGFPMPTLLYYRAMRTCTLYILSHDDNTNIELYMYMYMDMLAVQLERRYP